MSERFTTIAEYHAGLREKKFSAHETITELFSYIEKKNQMFTRFLICIKMMHCVKRVI
jgi:Asp-tRNA(Asn)/Glu-tRNA(Gln) amidotransferase A subunit family amidase